MRGDFDPEDSSSQQKKYFVKAALGFAGGIM
jgi:hypothetical protein